MSKLQSTQSISVDWFRVVIPYTYDLMPNKYHKSRSGKKIQAVKPVMMKALHEVNHILSYVFHLPKVQDKFEDDEVTGKWEEIPPLWSYDCGYKYNSIRIFFNNGYADERMPKTRAEMGIAIEMSGRAVREFETQLHIENLTWEQFIKRLFAEQPNAKVTRFDVALDIINGYRSMSPRNMLRLAKNQQISTKIKTFKYIETGSTKTGECLGDTFYLGSTGFKLRVYDKKKERIHSHGDYISDNHIETWIRWEQELTGDYVKSFIHEILNGEDIAILYFRTLNTIMKIVQDSKGKKVQRSKLPMLKWWENFVTQKDETIKKMNVLRPERIKDVGRMNNYLENQVSKTLFKRLFVCSQSGGDPKRLLTHWINEGMKKLTYNDVIEIKNLVTDEYEYKRNNKPSHYIPDRILLDLTDDDYKEIKKKLERMERFHNRLF